LTEEQQEFLQLLAYIYLQNARPEKAVVLLAALDQLAPGQPRVLRPLALALVRAGKGQRALETLERLAMTGHVNAAFHLLRSQALHVLERREEAALAMQAYIQLRSPAMAEAG
jgi:regulator of sirC expression with transglutaminase-like and TPR domain